MDGLLAAPTGGPQEVTGMSRMVANPKDLLDQGGDPAACPYLPNEAAVFGSFGQQFWQSGGV